MRWSDGTLSLQLGAEMFDMTLALDDSATLTATGGAAAAAQTSGGVNPQTSGLVASAFDLARGHGLTYLSARHTYAGTPLSETQASVHGTMSFRPATLASQTHRRLAGSIAGRYANQGRRGLQKADMPTIDPEKMRQQRERAEVEKQKKARREAAKAAGKSGGRSGGRKGGKKATTIEGLDSESGGDEDDDDEDGTGYGGYRRAQPKRGKGGPLNRDYEDEDDDGFLVQSGDECVLLPLFLTTPTFLVLARRLTSSPPSSHPPPTLLSPSSLPPSPSSLPLPRSLSPSPSLSLSQRHGGGRQRPRGARGGRRRRRARRSPPQGPPEAEGQAARLRVGLGRRRWHSRGGAGGTEATTRGRERRGVRGGGPSRSRRISYDQLCFRSLCNDCTLKRA